MFIFISGSSGSGKSFYAENKLLALTENKSERRIYIATSQIYDEEMRARVARHKAMRSGKNFITIEKTHDLGEITGLENACILIEDLASWTANEMFAKSGVRSPELVSTKIYSDLTKIHRRSKHVILVSCEIFSDGVKYDDLTERYIRTLALLHIKFASLADEVIEIISGQPVYYII